MDFLVNFYFSHNAIHTRIFSPTHVSKVIKPKFNKLIIDEFFTIPYLKCVFLHACIMLLYSYILI